MMLRMLIGMRARMRRLEKGYLAYFQSATEDSTIDQNMGNM